MHCCYGGIENDWDFFGPNWSLRHENLETLIKTVVKFEILPTRAFQSKAIETGMILLNMDMKNQLLCVFFIDLYSPR